MALLGDLLAAKSGDPDLLVLGVNSCRIVERIVKDIATSSFLLLLVRHLLLVSMHLFLLAFCYY